MEKIEIEKELTRQDEIHEKGFSFYTGANFNKMRIGGKLEHQIDYLNSKVNRTNRRVTDKEYVITAIERKNFEQLREISDYWYRASGIYKRILEYFAFMYTYDWSMTPVIGKSKVSQQKILEDYKTCLYILEDFHIKETLGKIALSVMKDGVYYGYLIEQEDKTYVLQELPIKYCRSRYHINGYPAVELNLRYFDDAFPDINYRHKILKLFPKEIMTAYMTYKRGKLKKDFNGDDDGWFLLDTTKAVKFNLNNEDYPPFIFLIPLIIDLEDAQKLDKDKTIQRLTKLIIQKLPLDKNGELLFDIEEARQIHQNAVAMVQDVIGVQVLTTFADVEVEDLDGDSDQQDDDLARVERQLYNEAGVSQMLFNTDGNLALERSMLNDAATIRDLILQFERFLNLLTYRYNNVKKVIYKVQILPTTIYNYKELAKAYKEQTTLGYSLMLPQISLGISQSTVLANLEFENEYLHLPQLMCPPLSSSTATGNDIRTKGGEAAPQDKKNEDKKVSKVKVEEKSAGRPEKADEEKSDKTIRNIESGAERKDE